MGKTAIVIGATGLTGGILTKLLLQDTRYVKVKLLSRRSIGFEHPKLEEHIMDMQQMELYKELFNADEIYCCIGTTKAKTPDELMYRKVDFDIPVMASKIAREMGVSTFVVMSSLGADKKSKLFYSRLKGEMEEEVQKSGIKKIVIVRPSLINGRRQEKRTGETIGKLVMNIINPLLFGNLRQYQSISPTTIAEAMVWLANHNLDKSIFLSNELKQIVKNAS